MAEGVRRGHLAMGRVSIWAQWLIVVSGVLLSPLFVLFMAGVIGGSLFRKPGPATNRPAFQLRAGDAAAGRLSDRLGATAKIGVGEQ